MVVGVGISLPDIALVALITGAFGVVVKLVELAFNRANASKAERGTDQRGFYGDLRAELDDMRERWDAMILERDALRLDKIRLEYRVQTLEAQVRGFGGTP